LNIYFGINNERQDCKTGTVYVRVLVGRGSVNIGGDDDEGIGLTSFMYVKEME
jgi:hypothetical protein